MLAEMADATKIYPESSPLGERSARFCVRFGNNATENAYRQYDRRISASPTSSPETIEVSPYRGCGTMYGSWNFEFERVISVESQRWPWFAESSRRHFSRSARWRSHGTCRASMPERVITWAELPSMLLFCGRRDCEPTALAASMLHEEKWMRDSTISASGTAQLQQTSQKEHPCTKPDERECGD